MWYICQNLIRIEGNCKIFNFENYIRNVSNPCVLTVKFLQPYFYFLTFIFFSLKFISFSSNFFSSSNSCLLPFALSKFHLVLNFLSVTIGSVKIKVFHISAQTQKFFVAGQYCLLPWSNGSKLRAKIASALLARKNVYLCTNFYLSAKNSKFFIGQHLSCQ